VAKSVGYESAGTVEFLMDSDHRFYFLEMNTRLQVEHPVTEQVTGVDVVQEMLRIAAGEPLSVKQREVKVQGHAIEARITAQDPEKDFAPSTGAIKLWQAPGGPGVRVETHCFCGFEITPYYDPMLAKLIVTAPDREQAVRRLQGALREFGVDGITTNIPFLRKLVAHPSYIGGQVDTGFVPRFLAESGDEE
jgi:acetyl-CoA carboxylase biotin carboxylase subunit